MQKRLYYTPPSDQAFEEVKREAIKLWREVDSDGDKYGYASEKIGRIKDIANIEDNAMYIVAMFDPSNRHTLISRLSEETKHAIEERIIDGLY